MVPKDADVNPRRSLWCLRLMTSRLVVRNVIGLEHGTCVEHGGAVVVLQ